MGDLLLCPYRKPICDILFHKSHYLILLLCLFLKSKMESEFQIKQEIAPYSTEIETNIKEEPRDGFENYVGVHQIKQEVNEETITENTFEESNVNTDPLTNFALPAGHTY